MRWSASTISLCSPRFRESVQGLQNSRLAHQLPDVYKRQAVDTYEVGRRVHNRVPFLETRDMTLEAAYTKLMWILGGKISSWNELETAFYSPINYDLSF